MVQTSKRSKRKYKLRRSVTGSSIIAGHKAGRPSDVNFEEMMTSSN
ncbi:MAG TPA: hypothetical protein VJ729_14700 [Nitrososphaeraceae archaeon]|nr:hypothetical protein [Nitrososphaeraceae archaeon]